MKGVVTADLEAVLHIVVRGPNGNERELDAVIDTGFNGYLTLPRATIESLVLPFQSHADATLADGRTVFPGKYEARLVWDQQVRDIMVLEFDSAPLLGMSLLAGSRLTLDVVSDGLATIEPLRS